MSEPGVLIAGRYRLRSRIGAGGMGAVWESWDERLQRPVALKLLHRTPGLDEEQARLANLRAMREARITARLHHRYAVPVFDVVEHEGQACLVMPLLPSMTLAAVLRDGGPLSVAETVQVGRQIASALAAAHQAGIVHRDVKPDNILVTEDGTALISDFGIAHALGEGTLTNTGLIHGTPAYLAPEVARGGDAIYASDVFSFGATLYEAIEGAPPFGRDQNSIALLHRIAAGHVEPPKRGGGLTPVMLRALEPDPQSRPSMAALAQALSALAAGIAEPIAPPDPRSGGTPVVPDQGPATTQSPPRPAIAIAGITGETPIATAGPSMSQTGPPRSAQQHSPAPPSRRGTGTRVGLLVGAVVLLGGTIAALLFQQSRSQEDLSAVRSSAQTSRPTSASTVTRPSKPATRSSTAGPPVSPTGSTTTAPRPGPSARTAEPSSPPSPQSPTVRGTPTAAELTRAITSYYTLMPNRTDQAWPRMTPAYQTNHAGGKRAYENFWRPVRRVTADNVSGRPPDGAEATITYYYRHGRVVRERTAYRLTNDGGALKIADSRVLSSETL